MSNNEKKNSKNKLFKGSVAAAAGVALLLGGAGTFALWNDTVNLGTTGVIDAGHLRFASVGDGQWQINGNDIGSPDDVAVSPGDVLTYTTEVGIIAHGDYLLADFGYLWGGAAIGTDGNTERDANDQLMTEDTAGQDLYDAMEVSWTVNSTSDRVSEVVDSDGSVIRIVGMGGQHDANHNMAPVPVSVALTFDFQSTDDMGALGQGGRLDLGDFQLTLQQVAHPDHGTP